MSTLLKRIPRPSNRTIILLVSLLLIMLLVSCLPAGGRYHSMRPAGFLSGIWHGWLAPLSLILGIFNNNIRIYETFNTGWWYDFGFYIAVISGFGGLSLVRKNAGK